MRLLNTKTLQLEHFHENRKPEYAILSHTWEQDEVLFADIQTADSTQWESKKGALKVERSAKIAANTGVEYIWIDTCCIDKSSSVELFEAINSMFRWYQESAICFAYLCDVERSPPDNQPFEASRWFTRAWTLQELIAPPIVLFFHKEWEAIGTRRELADRIHSTTKIDLDILRGNNPDLNSPRPETTHSTTDNAENKTSLEACSIHTKMNWASGRQATREEDVAYSLMGIFNVTMPLVYGEGGINAFTRLQEEIIKKSNDQSILVHNSSRYPLALRPDDFRVSFRLNRSPAEARHSLHMAKYGVDTSLLLCPLGDAEGLTIGMIESTFDADATGLGRPAILLKACGEDSKYRRSYQYKTLQVQHDLCGGMQVVSLDEDKKIIVPSVDHSKLVRAAVSIHTSSENMNGAPSLRIPKIHRLYLPPIENSAMTLNMEYMACYPKPYENIISSPGIALNGSTRLVACLFMRPYAAIVVLESSDRFWPALIRLQEWNYLLGIKAPILERIMDLKSAQTELKLDRWSEIVNAKVAVMETEGECSMKMLNGCLIMVRIEKTMMLENVAHQVRIKVVDQPSFTNWISKAVF